MTKFQALLQHSNDSQRKQDGSPSVSTNHSANELRLCHVLPTKQEPVPWTPQILQVIDNVLEMACADGESIVDASEYDTDYLSDTIEVEETSLDSITNPATEDSMDALDISPGSMDALEVSPGTPVLESDLHCTDGYYSLQYAENYGRQDNAFVQDNNCEIYFKVSKVAKVILDRRV